ncbi:MAG: pitrilysin family protein [Opitutaceae bacterium]|nr:pitrilysin family protein [Opitutaceae bacterium]
MRPPPRLALAAALSFAALVSGCATTTPPRTFPYAYEKHTLPNGLTAILVPMQSPGVVAYYSVVRTGSRDEVEEGKSGFAHFFEHMMFRGTPTFPQAVYEGIVTKMGANTNAYTTDDHTAYHLKFTTEDLPKVIEIEADRFQNLAFSRTVFQTEAGAVYGEYRKSISSPFSLLHERLQDLAYDTHTYKHTTIGFERDIMVMAGQFDYSLTFFKRFYRPENTVLVITGDFAPQPTLALIEKHYGGWARGYTAPAITPEPAQTAERTAEVTYPGKTLPILAVAYKGDAFDPANRDYVAALLLGELAFGETSELRKRLLLREQRVQLLGASIPQNRDQPLFSIYAMIKKPDDIAAIRDEIYATLEHFKTTPVDPQRLRDLKRRNKYSFLMGLDTPDAVAGGLARFISLTGDIAVIDQLYAAADAVTAEDIMNAAKKYFVPARRNVIVLKGGQS